MEAKRIEGMSIGDGESRKVGSENQKEGENNTMTTKHWFGTGRAQVICLCMEIHGGGERGKEGEVRLEAGGIR